MVASSSYLAILLAAAWFAAAPTSAAVSPMCVCIICLGQWHPRPLACLWTMGSMCCSLGVCCYDAHYYTHATPFGLDSVVFCSSYQKLAIDVLKECYSSNQQKATLLVVHIMTNYGYTTPLQLAVHADCKEFMAEEVCQNALTAIWCGRLREDYALWKVICKALWAM